MKKKKLKKYYNISRNVFLCLFFFFSLFSFSEKVFALDIQGSSTITNTGQIGGMNSSPQNVNDTNVTIINIEKGTYPTIDTHLEGPNMGPFSWSAINGTTLSTYMAGGGNYFLTAVGETTGNTYVFCYNSPNGSTGYTVISCNIPTTNSTRITWINPPKTTPSATTTSDTINFEFEYFFNSFIDTQENGINTKLLLTLCPISYPDDKCQHETITETIITNQITNISESITTNRKGYYLGIISFWNGITENTECTWWNFLCEENTIVLNYSSSNNFNVATTTIEADIPPVIETLFGQCNSGTYFDLAICETLVFLFYPSENSLQFFESTKQNFKTKLPFALITKITGTAYEITSSTTATQGSDLVVSIESLGNASTTIFSWTSAKDFFDNTLGTEPMEILTMITWLLFGGYITTTLALRL